MLPSAESFDVQMLTWVTEEERFKVHSKERDKDNPKIEKIYFFFLIPCNAENKRCVQ